MITKFCRHDKKSGHVIEQKRCGFPPKIRNRRFNVKLIDEKWIDKDGRDLSDEIVVVMLRELINKT